MIWGGVCFLAFSLDKSQANVDYYFYGLGIVLGFVLGATQSIGRSTYSKLLPDTHDHATYFSFYDVMEKVGLIFGPFLFGFLEGVFGNMRVSVLMVMVFFMQVGYRDI